MSKLYVQHAAPVLSYSGSLAAATAITGSAHCAGYARLVGFITSDASSASESASFFSIKQSVDSGANFDYTSASNLFGAGGGSAACAATVVGNAVKVYYKSGISTIANLRTGFWLLPI